MRSFSCALSFAARVAAHARPVGDVLQHVHVREQRVGLEHHADVALRGRRRVTSRPPMVIVPELAISSPAISRSVVVLPQPDGPEQRDQRARLDAERDVVDRGDAAVALRRRS